MEEQYGVRYPPGSFVTMICIGFLWQFTLKANETKVAQLKMAMMAACEI